MLYRGALLFVVLALLALGARALPQVEMQSAIFVRGSPVHADPERDQVTCKGESMACQGPSRIACQNYGWDGQTFQWECKSMTDEPFTFSSFKVVCVAVGGQGENVEIVDNSCGLVYVPEYDFSNNMMIGLACLAVLGVIVLCMTGNGTWLFLMLLRNKKRNGGFGGSGYA